MLTPEVQPCWPGATKARKVNSLDPRHLRLISGRPSRSSLGSLQLKARGLPSHSLLSPHLPIFPLLLTLQFHISPCLYGDQSIHNILYFA